MKQACSFIYVGTGFDPLSYSMLTLISQKYTFRP